MTTVRYEPEPRSVTLARVLVTDELAEVDPEVVELAALAVSELAANAVRHAGTDFTVSVRCLPDEVVVEVEDAGEGRPAVQHPDPATPTGRGLAIVERITDGWGVKALAGGGNRVWFRLSLAGPGTGEERPPRR